MGNHPKYALPDFFAAFGGIFFVPVAPIFLVFSTLFPISTFRLLLILLHISSLEKDPRAKTRYFCCLGELLWKLIKSTPFLPPARPP